MDSNNLTEDGLTIMVGEERLDFQRVNLTFLAHGLVDVFGKKNNKTVRETLAHKRYTKIDALINEEFRSEIDKPLGDFLLGLKASGISLYKRFLNPYGDSVYCRFKMERGPLSLMKGLYCYCIDQRIYYAGRSMDPFEKRITQGYEPGRDHCSGAEPGREPTGCF